MIVDRGQGFDQLDRVQRLKLFTRGKIGEQKRKEFLKDLQRRSKVGSEQRNVYKRDAPKIEIRQNQEMNNHNGMRSSLRGGSYRVDSSYKKGRSRNYSSSKRKNNSFECQKNFSSEQNYYQRGQSQNKSFDFKQFRKNSSLKKNQRAPTFNDILNKARNYRQTNYSKYRPNSRREYLTFEKSHIDSSQIKTLQKDSLIALRATIDRRLTELERHDQVPVHVKIRHEVDKYPKRDYRPEPSFNKKGQSSIVKTIKIPRRSIRREDDPELVEENFHINIKTSQKNPHLGKNESEYRIIDQSRYPVPQDEVLEDSFAVAKIEERKEEQGKEGPEGESKGSSMVYELLDHTQEDEDEILDTSPSELEIKNYIHEHYENSLM